MEKYVGSESIYSMDKNILSQEKFGYQRLKTALSASIFWDAVGRAHCAVRKLLLNRNMYPLMLATPHICP